MQKMVAKEGINFQDGSPIKMNITDDMPEEEKKEVKHRVSQCVLANLNLAKSRRTIQRDNELEEYDLNVRNKKEHKSPTHLHFSQCYLADKYINYREAKDVPILNLCEIDKKDKEHFTGITIVPESKKVEEVVNESKYDQSIIDELDQKKKMFNNI